MKISKYIIELPITSNQYIFSDWIKNFRTDWTDSIGSNLVEGSD